MKKIFLLIITIIWIIGCENQPISFPDYELQAVYFPYQTPVRTLSVGEDRIDNSLDRDFKFDIAVNIGGMYKNDRNWTVDFEVDDSLTSRVYLITSPQLYNNNTKIKPLPHAYYTLTPVSTVTIPSGSFIGTIRFQLTSTFFDDTTAITGQYVIPLKITSTSADSILMGKAAITGADPRIKSHWEANMSPKYWVLFGINYVNAYHGTYLHRGRDIRSVTATGAVFDTINFRAPFNYREKDPLIVLSTISRKRVITNGIANLTGTNYSMVLEFDNDKGDQGTITVKPRPGFPYAVTGTGQYFNIANSKEKWTGLTFQSMYLNYTYTDATYTHTVVDSLVFRDRGIKFTQNTIVVKP